METLSCLGTLRILESTQETKGFIGLGGNHVVVLHCLHDSVLVRITPKSLRLMIGIVDGH